MATEISPDAVGIAQKNAVLHQVDNRVRVLENNLLDGQKDPFDLIYANLPYIPSKSLRQLKVFHTEPTLALDGGEDGLEIISALLTQAVDLLSPGGLILLEIGDGRHLQNAGVRSFSTGRNPDRTRPLRV